MNTKEEQIYNEALYEREEAIRAAKEINEADIWGLFREREYYPINYHEIISENYILNISGSCIAELSKVDIDNRFIEYIERSFDVDIEVIHKSGNPIYYEPFNF